MKFVYDSVEVLRVIDGDTIEVKLRVDIGFKVYAEMIQHIRLARLDAPEIRGEERVKGEMVKRYVEGVVEKARFAKSKIIIETKKVGKYGRYIGEVFIDGNNLNEELLEKGLAKETNYGDAKET